MTTKPKGNMGSALVKFLQETQINREKSSFKSTRQCLRLHQKCLEIPEKLTSWVFPWPFLETIYVLMWQPAQLAWKYGKIWSCTPQRGHLPDWHQYANPWWWAQDVAAFLKWHQGQPERSAERAIIIANTATKPVTWIPVFTAVSVFRLTHKITRGAGAAGGCLWWYIRESHFHLCTVKDQFGVPAWNTSLGVQLVCAQKGSFIIFRVTVEES